MKSFVYCLTLGALCAVPAGCSGVPTSAPASARPATDSSNASVHCLLPPRVQKLGGIVYPARRELVYETATRCELRGGEYTVYDRSTAQSSADFYRPLAEAGDPEAQYSLGLVYESLFSEPDYGKAAHWYQLAAAQNHSGAMKNLSYLYETGLGVDEDPVLAVNLLRRAGGITDDLVLKSEADAALTMAEAEINQLTERLEQQNAQTAEFARSLARADSENAKRRATLGEMQSRMAELETQLASVRRQGDATSSPEKAARIRELEQTVADYERQIADQQIDIAAFESDMKVYRARLAASEQKASLQEARLAEQLASVQTAAEEELTSAASAMTARDAEIDRLTAALDALRKRHQQTVAEQSRLSEQLSRSRSTATTAESDRVARLERELSDRARLISEQTDDILNLEREVHSAQQAMLELESENQSRVREASALKARLALVEKELVGTKAELQSARSGLESATADRQSLQKSVDLLRASIEEQSGIAGDALAELNISLQQQNQALAEKDRQIRELTAAVADKERALVAAREQREDQLLAMRATRRALSRPEYPTAPKMAPPIGKLHALIIGNDSYRHLPELKTAAGGARALDKMLREKYGFSTTLLINAKRQEMMDAFLELRQLLGPDDQLLIYYGGHGDIDPDDQKVSYWLPVDARDNPMTLGTDGLKSTWITNEIRAMSAKHVMIIADSCYAGAMVRPTRVTVPRTSIDDRRLKFMVDRRSRTVLTSGATSPVLDRSLDSEHSLFTRSLLELLDHNEGMVYGEWLHAALVDLVRFDAEQVDFEQIPQFSEIADAEHGNGQFVLVSRS